MQKVYHKRGDTFLPDCTYLDSTGVAAAYASLGISIKSQVRTRSGQLVSNLTVTAGTGIGEFILDSGATEDWPIGSLLWDVQFTQGGHIFSTQSAELVVSDDVTV